MCHWLEHCYRHTTVFEPLLTILLTVFFNPQVSWLPEANHFPWFHWALCCVCHQGTTTASNSSAIEFTITPLKYILNIFSTFCQNRNLNCITIEKLLVLQCYVYTSTKSSLKTIHLIVQLTFSWKYECPNSNFLYLFILTPRSRTHYSKSL